MFLLCTIVIIDIIAIIVNLIFPIWYNYIDL